MRTEMHRYHDPLSMPFPASATHLDLVASPSANMYLVARYGPSIPGGLDVHALGARQRVHRKRIYRGHRAAFVRVPYETHQAVFGVPASALVGRTIPIEEIWSRSAAEDLIGKLADTHDSATAASVLEDAIALRVASTPMDARHGFVRRAAGLLEHANVGEVSTQLGISDRHLRRVFQEVTGLNPKTFARLKRFDRAVSSALNNGESNWSSVAVDAGYYDQAHLIADFHVIAGTTPQKFLAEVRDQRRLIAFR